MEHEALIHTAAMLCSAFLGLLIGQYTDSDISEYLIAGTLAAMLYFVFICIDGSSLGKAFRNHRFTTVSILINFAWIPFFALGLGYLFFSGNTDVRIGLLLCLAAPCTDWYLVFTAAAKGDLAASSAILPLNMILQIILVPTYLVLFFGTSVEASSAEPIAMALATLVVPFVIALVVRHYSNSIRELSETNASNGQIIFLCAAVFLMFLGCSQDITDNMSTLVWCVFPLLMFFIGMTLLAHLVSKALNWDNGLRSSLTFTVLARNSPLILAMMAPLFADRPLVLAVLVVCPLIELPFLSALSYIIGRKSEIVTE